MRRVGRVSVGGWRIYDKMIIRQPVLDFRMKELKPVKRSTLAEQVALQIAERINGGDWTPGGRLPSEADLCRTLGVGRSTLREALKSLAFVGIVDMRAGEGTFVANHRNLALDEILKGGPLGSENDVRDLAEARIIIETETAGLCAQWGRDEDMAVLDDLVSRMSGQMENVQEFRTLDIAFHIAIAEGSQNRVFARLLRIIRGSLEDYITRSLHMSHSAEVAHRQHSAIVEAIRSHDPRKARLAMRTHLLTFSRGYAILARISESDAQAESPSSQDATRLSSAV